MDLTSLISQAPGVAGVVIVVFAFLKYLDKRDKEWQRWISQRDQLLMAELKQFGLTLGNLESTIHAHDSWERKLVEDGQQVIVKKRRKRITVQPAAQ